MTPVQENLLKLLKEIDAICKKHDITYYLAGGTALGAVRNNGFLPWDDDMDLYITRENWKKLEKVIDSEIRPDRGYASTDRNELYHRTGLDTLVVRTVNDGCPLLAIQCQRPSESVKHPTWGVRRQR